MGGMLVSAAAVEGTRFMPDTDYDGILKVAQQDNPPDPAGTPANKAAVTIAIIVEIDAKNPLTGIGHTGIAIGVPGGGFDPANMEYYDFGPAHTKDTTNPNPVPGSPWWDIQAPNTTRPPGTELETWCPTPS